MADDGGPAFPNVDSVDPSTLYQKFDGMTLRDWFAGKERTEPPAPFVREYLKIDGGGLKWQEHRDVAVAWRYEMAAAMLAEKRRREDDNG